MKNNLDFSRKRERGTSGKNESLNPRKIPPLSVQKGLASQPKLGNKQGCEEEGCEFCRIKEIVSTLTIRLQRIASLLTQKGHGDVAADINIDLVLLTEIHNTLQKIVLDDQSITEELEVLERLQTETEDLNF